MKARAKGEERAPDRFQKWLAEHERLALLGVVAAALALRAAHLVEIEANDPFFYLPPVDPQVYHDWAVAISQGDFWGEGVFFLSPLYPYFLSAIYALFGDGHMIGKVAQMALGLVDCLLVYLIGKRIFGRETGFYAACLSAVYVMFIFFEGILLVTSLQTPLNLVAVLLLLRCHDRPSAARWLAAGAALGLSALARPNVLLFAGPVLAWIYLAFKDRLDKRKMLVAGLVFCCGIGVAVFPVTLRNWVVGGDLVLVSSQGGVNFYIGNGPDATGKFVVPSVFPPTQADDPLQQEQTYRRYAEQKLGRELKPSEVSDFWFEQALEHIRSYPGRSLHLLAHKLALFLNQFEIASSLDFYLARDFSAVLRLPLPGFGLVGPLALVGMALAWRQRERAFLLHAMVLTYALSLVIFFVLAHYRMPVIPFFILFAAVTISRLKELVAEKRIATLALIVLALVAAALFVNQDLHSETRNRFMVHYNLGNRYRMLKKHDLAIKQYKKSIEQNPRYISAYNNLAFTYESSPETYDQAIETWRTVLQMASEERDQQRAERALQHIRWLLDQKRQGSSVSGPR